MGRAPEHALGTGMNVCIRSIGRPEVDGGQGNVTDQGSPRLVFCSCASYFIPLKKDNQ